MADGDIERLGFHSHLPEPPLLTHLLSKPGFPRYTIKWEAGVHNGTGGAPFRTTASSICESCWVQVLKSPENCFLLSLPLLFCVHFDVVLLFEAVS